MAARQQQDDFDDGSDDDEVDRRTWEGSDEDLNDAEELWQDEEPKEKMGTKKMRKLQEKAVKKERREVFVINLMNDCFDWMIDIMIMRIAVWTARDYLLCLS